MSNTLETWLHGASSTLGAWEGKIFGFNPIAPGTSKSGLQLQAGGNDAVAAAHSTSIPGMVGSGLIGLVAGGLGGFLAGRATAGGPKGGPRHPGYHIAKSGPHKGQLIKSKRHRFTETRHYRRRPAMRRARARKGVEPAALKRWRLAHRGRRRAA